MAWACAVAGIAHGADAPPEPAGCERIGAIRIQRVDVFDTTLPEEDKPLYRLANALHVQTRESTVQQLLLFHTGDAYEPRLLQETERILRATGYLGEAHVRTLACPGGAAEIMVRVQDVWTLKPEVSYGRKGGQDSTSFGIEESNLFGLGSQLGLDFSSGLDRSSRTLSYRDPLLGGRRLDLAAHYSHNSDGTSRSLGLERPFYALDTRWAGGAKVERDVRTDTLYAGGQVVAQYESDDRYAQVYGGWSDGLRAGWATRWTLGVTHDEHRTPGAVDPVLVASERRLVYPWVGLELVQDEFRVARNQDQIGKTEDIALGWHVKGLLGAATPRLGADRRATIFKLEFSRGWEPGAGRLLLANGRAAGRWEHERPVGTLLSGTARYYQRHSAQRSLFLSFTADRALRPDADQQVLLGGDSGLRGYPVRYQSGQGRWLATAEHRWYTDWYPWRLFYVGGAVFYDVGRVWRRDPRSTTPQGSLRDVGLGLRLGNSRAAIGGNVVHIDLAFPLDAPPGIRKVQWLVEAKRSF